MRATGHGGGSQHILHRCKLLWPQHMAGGEPSPHSTVPYSIFDPGKRLSTSTSHFRQPNKEATMPGFCLVLSL